MFEKFKYSNTITIKSNPYGEKRSKIILDYLKTFIYIVCDTLSNLSYKEYLVDSDVLLYEMHKDAENDSQYYDRVMREAGKC